MGVKSKVGSWEKKEVNRGAHDAICDFMLLSRGTVVTAIHILSILYTNYRYHTMTGSGTPANIAKS